MNTKLLMTTSSLFLGAIGLVLIFLPEEIIFYLNIETNALTTLLVKILSSFYLGFALLNWMTKDTFIGGIYNKPIAIGNQMHFGVGAISLLKIVFEIQSHYEIIIALTVGYIIFATGFSYVFFNNPKRIEMSK